LQNSPSTLSFQFEVFIVQLLLV